MLYFFVPQFRLSKYQSVLWPILNEHYQLPAYVGSNLAMQLTHSQLLIK